MKKITLLICMVLTGSLLSGCGVMDALNEKFDHMPNLTDEEARIISEYATSVVVQHNPDSGRLASDYEIMEADRKEAIRLANLAEIQEALAKAETETEDAEAEDAGKKGEGEETPETTFEGIAPFCKMNDFSVEYVGHTITDSYPDDGSEEKFFAMDATAGNKLLVLRFAVTNTTDADRELDMFSKGVTFKIGVNGQDPKNALSTMLLDDFSLYKDTIPAGMTNVLVLTREISQQEADSLSGITLQLKNASEEATTSLE